MEVCPWPLEWHYVYGCQVTAELEKTAVGESAWHYDAGAVRFRNAFLRRVFVENPVLLLGFEPGLGPEWRKRKRAMGERILHRHEYWAVVDARYEEMVKRWGTDMTQHGWKGYVEETLQKEKDGYADIMAIGITLKGEHASSDISTVASNVNDSFIHAMTGGM
ncbi:hypothetical protein V5O48_004775 [Marasmius crinis-equi]|uniref:Uncharacterized protein n=1 Tax=Marasmius crinis-equi TaxID=585013 RepID=A0ABR3FQ27_9AGAR